MRSFLAGFLFLSALALSFTPSAMGQQVDGQVLSLGFTGNFRGDCWTPLKVQLKNHQNDAKNYMIQVHQQDLDKDTVVYTRVVPLGPNATTDYWVYFVPQPTGGGLGGKALGDVLKVYLYDETGKTLITPLPLTFSSGYDIDALNGMGGRGRGWKLVLVVIGANDNPNLSEYAGALGVTENVVPVPLKVEAGDLPGSVLGYQAVDAIVWFDAPARDISSGGSGAFEAIQQYVKEGGQLVICQPAEKGLIGAFADAGMLPIEAKEAGAWSNDFKPEPKPDLQPLYDIVVNNDVQTRAQNRAAQLGLVWPKTDRNWDLVRKSNKEFPIYRAKAKPDAVVDMKVDWGTKSDGTPDETPYIARRAYGAGSVVWVAQDLGSRTLTTVQNPTYNPRNEESHTVLATGGWPYVWDKVFGWNNRTIIKDDWSRSEKDTIPHPEYHADGAPTVDIADSLASGMEASARGAWLVTVAIFFFIVYWIVAGPGSYFFLAQRKRKGMSWGVFAAAALVATAVTVGVVKLVLRGDPEIHHITISRLVPEEPAADGSPRYGAVTSSRFGLYIPRDGVQTVELTGAGDKEPSYVIPLPLRLKEDNSGFTDTQTYSIATDALLSGDVSVGFPYRSTLKKIQTQWVGTSTAGITGSAQLIQTYDVPDPADPSGKKKIRHGPLKGTLNNGTGRDLHDVYVAFHWDSHTPNPAADEVLYVRTWQNGATLDLDVEWTGAKNVNALPGLDKQVTPTADEAARAFKGEITSDVSQWCEYWIKGLKHASVMEQTAENDAGNHYIRTLPLMAFIDRVPPFKGEQTNSDWYRADLLRRGGRVLNVSQSVASGRLVVVAQGEGPVPYPLKVDGSPVGGEGVTFYEVSLPLEDKQPLPSTTRPTTNPTTNPTTKPAKPGEKPTVAKSE